MKQKSILSFAFLLILVALIYQYHDLFTDSVSHTSHRIKKLFITQKNQLQETINIHFNQVKKIQELEKKIQELEPKASLSIAFAGKLNHLLKESNTTQFNPKLHLIQSLGHQSLLEPAHIWLDFKEFNQSKSYGLLYQGFTAGVIHKEKDLPVGVLQHAKEILFSVSIGQDHIQGVAYGAGEFIEIRYIPEYENPKVGDRVLTSGDDHIFYEGIPVGEIIRIQKNRMYKIATVKPYVDPKDAQFFYAVEVK